jgi:hypothetical protein
LASRQGFRQAAADERDAAGRGGEGDPRRAAVARLGHRRAESIESPSDLPITPPMRLSRFSLATSKETPADAEIASHQLMLRAGLIRKLGAGLYTWMPLAVPPVPEL